MVLAGGRNRRFGGAPKGLEIVGETRIVDHVASALRTVTRELLLVANNPDAARWLPGVAVVSDAHRGAGGLAGVEAALGRGRDALVVAWDMPFITGDVLQLVIDSARGHDADVALPESDSPYGLEPFCAYYAARVRERLTEFLDGGGGAAREFLSRLARVHVIPVTEIDRLGHGRRLFFSVNTPHDLERARAMANAAE